MKHKNSIVTISLNILFCAALLWFFSRNAFLRPYCISKKPSPLGASSLPVAHRDAVPRSQEQPELALSSRPHCTFQMPGGNIILCRMVGEVIVKRTSPPPIPQCWGFFPALFDLSIALGFNGALDSLLSSEVEISEPPPSQNPAD